MERVKPSSGVETIGQNTAFESGAIDRPTEKVSKLGVLNGADTSQRDISWPRTAYYSYLERVTFIIMALPFKGSMESV